MKLFLLHAVAVAALALTATAVASSPQSQREWQAQIYARQLAAQQGWTGYQWDDLVQIIHPESGWDPCSVYPSQHVCDYQGSNSCGVPQADPCPWEWQGRLAGTWRAQVRWLIAYVKSRYGTPAAALAYHIAHGSY